MTDPTSYAAGIEDAARACERQMQDFLSEQYATGQPASSFAERFACGKCIEAIRSLSPAPPAAPSGWVETLARTICRANGRDPDGFERHAHLQLGQRELERNCNRDAPDYADRLTTAAQAARDALEPFCRYSVTSIWADAGDFLFRVITANASQPKFAHFDRAREALASLASVLDGGEG